MEDVVTMAGIFGGFWRNRRVLVTGHTGFKGAWLSHWLLNEGAEVSGYALAPATEPALFSLLGLDRRMRHTIGDVRDANGVAAAVAAARPEVVLHLAAQPLVRLSYREPRVTWETNVGGTVNLLEAVRTCGGVRACVVVTSDKCYENREWAWGYRENEPMGGHDPYSSSKGAAELAVSSWRRSFFNEPSGCRLASARAGNVIGGGDWSADRIVTDFVLAIQTGRPLRLRNPRATRPWQHVLEPLSGYMHLAWHLCQEGGHRYADGWNFGPADSSVATVEHLARLLVAAYGSGAVEAAQDPANLHEAGLLKLDCSKATSLLGWRGVWDVATTTQRTALWYRAQRAGSDVNALVNADITAYQAASAHCGQPWAVTSSVVSAS
jgi:CDP-glucose 4,6-dehydratase